MRHFPAGLAAGLLSLTLLAACQSESSKSDAGGAPMKEDQSSALARYTQYAGEPVKQFNWLGKFDSWEPLSADQLVVYTTPTTVYLLKVWRTVPQSAVRDRHRTHLHGQDGVLGPGLGDRAGSALPDLGDPPGQLRADACRQEGAAGGGQGGRASAQR